jgi:hypothetical protein
MRRAAHSPRTVARVVIVVGVLLVIATLLLDMSGSASRLTGSNGVRTEVFATVVPGGGTVCEPVGPLPPGTGAAKLLVGTYYRPLPALRLSFLNRSGGVVASGEIHGGPQGYVTIDLRHHAPLSTVTRVCLRDADRFQIALGGTRIAGPPVGEVVDGKPASALFAIYYLQRSSASWWQFLPVLNLRFALGKASFFGSWTLPLVALLVLVVWVAAITLVWRELG